MLIHTFLSQAISPSFPTNIYLNSLYRWHVLEDRDLPDPGRPPYYSAAFFNTIQDVHLNTPLNVTWVTVKQWCQLLLESGATHTSEDHDSPAVLIPSKFEESNPSTDFKVSYRLARQFGLTPEEKSFVFKMIQNLLPTKERLHRSGKSPTPSCAYCDAQLDTTEHLLVCSHSTEVSTPLLTCLSSQVDNLSTKDVICLNLHTSESWELPAVWLVATCMNFIWEERIAGRRARLETCRAELLARVGLLKQTRWKHYSLHNSALLLDEAINLHFN